ncbi:MAG: hypothetical protein ACRDSP_26480 [Pseudonocardiaceae bacterium]
MLKTDQALWQQELDEHLHLHGADLLKLPHLTVPVAAMSRRRRLLLTALLVWTPVTVVGSTIGWTIGWYIV